MSKKIIGIIMCIIMSTTFVMAEDIIDSNINYTLTLEDAISIAMDDNPQLNASIAKKEDNQIQLKAAKESKSNAKYQYQNMINSMITTSLDLLYVKNGYYVHSAQKALELSDYEYRQIEAQIAYNVTEKYYNLKNCEKLVEIAQNSYNLVFENYNNAKLSYELGLISKVDFDNVGISLLQVDFALQSYKNNYEIAKEDFKIALRKNNENCNFTLTSNLSVEDFETNLTDDLVNAENSRYDIIALKINDELAKEYYDLTMSAATARKSAAKSSYITAHYNYTNNKSLILLGIKSSYNNINTSKNNVILSEGKLDLKRNEYKIAKVKYEQGMLTNTELLNILNDVYTAEVEYENAKLKYNLAVDKYRYDIQIGL